MQQKQLRIYGTDKGDAAFKLIGMKEKVDIPPESSDGGLTLGSDGVHYFKGEYSGGDVMGSGMTHFRVGGLFLGFNKFISRVV